MSRFLPVVAPTDQKKLRRPFPRNITKARVPNRSGDVDSRLSATSRQRWPQQQRIRQLKKLNLLIVALLSREPTEEIPWSLQVRTENERRRRSPATRAACAVRRPDGPLVVPSAQAARPFAGRPAACESPGSSRPRRGSASDVSDESTKSIPRERERGCRRWKWKERPARSSLIQPTSVERRATRDESQEQEES